jgi:hypothetical protein
MEFYRNMRSLGNPHTDLISYSDYVEKHGILLYDFEKIPSGGGDQTQTGINTLNQSVSVTLKTSGAPTADTTFTFVSGYLQSVLFKSGENTQIQE